jgi:hypothetical protein
MATSPRADRGIPSHRDGLGSRRGSGPVGYAVLKETPGQVLCKHFGLHCHMTTHHQRPVQ